MDHHQERGEVVAIGHKRAQDLIVRWRFAGLDDVEFEVITGRTFANAAGMSWDQLDQVEARLNEKNRADAEP
ncbi:hypothetical protein [Jiangella alkaliphila]|uniref:hypothetical protein n=1 Tax=Jiangella alkaliphila TaxID=419479 RepID=UPI00128D0D96|nr:hypothetical protein [Jiangella alkaliphila]